MKANGTHVLKSADSLTPTNKPNPTHSTFQTMPVFLKAPDRNSRGPDGHGWNRLRIDTLQGADQCAIIPNDYASLKYESCNTLLAKWGNCGKCFNNGSCTGCKMLTPTHFDCCADRLLVRIDNQNRPWIMNRIEKGWGEFGIPKSWSFFARLEGWSIGDRYRDTHSQGFWIIKAHKHEHAKN